MGFSTSDVITLTNDGVVMHDYGSHHRVRGRITKPILGELDTSGDIFFIFCHTGSVLIPIFASENQKSYASHCK
jgi:hypothetical protein